MRKTLLTMLLAVASSNAVAEWIMVGNNENDTLYADSATIIKSAHKVKMRMLHDYKKAIHAAGETFLSTAAQEEYDCQKNQARTLNFSFHSKNMGKGWKIYSETAHHNWEPVRPGSAREALWNFACRNK